MTEKILSLSKKDFTIQTFRCGGPGGQKQNKTSSGVRIIHEASGAVGESREQRSQKANMNAAFSRLLAHEKFKFWLKMEVSRRTGKLDEIKEAVERQMDARNIRVEAQVDGRWTEIA